MAGVRRWATAWLALMLLAVAGCSEDVSERTVADDLSHSEAADVGNLALPRPVGDHPDPRIRAGAAGRLVACDGPVHLGGHFAEFEEGWSADPDGALNRFLDELIRSVPSTDYRPAAESRGRVLFTHDVDGVPKVAVIVANAAIVETGSASTDGWVVETFASCDPAEFDPSTDDQLQQDVWTDADGNRVATSVVTSFQGPEHCGWQSVTFLSLEDQQYLRDPEHRLEEMTVTRFDRDAELPTDAVDTGYRRGSEELWLAAEAAVAYLVTAATVEAWPSTTDHVACA